MAPAGVIAVPRYRRIKNAFLLMWFRRGPRQPIPKFVQGRRRYDFFLAAIRSSSHGRNLWSRAMRMTDFLMSALAFSMVMNVLCLGVALAAVIALRNDIRREYADKLRMMPAWARNIAKS
jgi:hypothetical protein